MSSIIDVAIKRLSDSSCSEYELRLFLEKEFSTLPNLGSQINAAFKRLKELQLISDLRLATHLAQHYAHKGNRFISQMLEQKGISEEIITKVLSSLENENVRALDEARKKLGDQWDRSENALNLLHRFLTGRSFSGPAIQTVIGQLEQSAA
ncbi:regulatory protein RecX [Legionella maceachernii]|uniref:Recombination regulator RecX n=1 Tax=Legionella maceachernii TaxID=466 RepID=A0A0W0VWA5_9GAMM|nr:regulatory protein RecX [Legionella maceachernii]KTD24596.1 recombination regulator RecX [Legionella maceachernii]SKA25428.1 regulatory protein [Legionella maceachernii]SUO99422.1 recombination regulator RecX [Legionella maceachernii]